MAQPDVLEASKAIFDQKILDTTDYKNDQVVHDFIEFLRETGFAPRIVPPESIVDKEYVPTRINMWLKKLPNGKFQVERLTVG